MQAFQAASRSRSRQPLSYFTDMWDKNANDSEGLSLFLAGWVIAFAVIGMIAVYLFVTGRLVWYRDVPAITKK